VRITKACNRLSACRLKHPAFYGCLHGIELSAKDHTPEISSIFAYFAKYSLFYELLSIIRKV
jgi:hypothetical protein